LRPDGIRLRRVHERLHHFNGSQAQLKTTSKRLSGTF
jgi:sensor histidine kinase YesM